MRFAKHGNRAHHQQQHDDKAKGLDAGQKLAPRSAATDPRGRGRRRAAESESS